MKTWTGVWTKVAVQMFVRVLILAEFVFSGFIQVRLVADCEFQTAMLDLSYIRYLA